MAAGRNSALGCQLPPKDRKLEDLELAVTSCDQSNGMGLLHRSFNPANLSKGQVIKELDRVIPSDMNRNLDFDNSTLQVPGLSRCRTGFDNMIPNNLMGSVVDLAQRDSRHV